ncbi:MAG: lipoprotein signal peptidase [Candidatus Binatia bacterium]|nr:MAG: lipoprotein signal peptidase [Candidatus Binatia bacterium]
MSKYSIVLGLASLIVVADQITKWLVIAWLPLFATVEIIPGIAEITHVKNTGGAFGFLARADESWRWPFFIFASVLAIVLLWQVVRRTRREETGALFAVGSILGGAIGNLIDRAREGAVTDFISIHWREYYWPAFNVADSFISIGVALLVWQSLRTGSTAAAREKQAS